MKRVIFLLLFVSIHSGCSSSPPSSNPSAGQIPVGLQCPGSLDPNQACPTPSTPAVPVNDQGLRPRLEAAEKVGKTITGRCELVVEGATGVRPCTELTLRLRSVVGEEVRPVLMDGYNIRAGDLGQENYLVEASSEKYEVSTDSGAVQPGQIVKIRVRGKALRR